MDPLTSLLAGFAVALQPINLMWALVGSVLGTAIGILPGIGPALTIALLLPVTAQIAPTSAFIMFAGILYGAMYGGSTTSILLNTPGESGSMMTALEGNQMARRGRGAAALATAAIGSFVAGTIATLALTFPAPAIAELAFVFGPADYFALMVLSFTSVSVVHRRLARPGLHRPVPRAGARRRRHRWSDGQARLTFGSPELFDGIELTVVLVSLFAVGETIYVASRYPADAPGDQSAVRRLPHDARRTGGDRGSRGCAARRSAFRSARCRPAAPEIPTFLSYTLERRLARDGRRNSAAAPSRASPDRRRPTTRQPPAMLVPLLTLGLPTSATAAVLLAAFQNYGLQPGPFLFINNADLVWGLIASLYVGNVMLLVLNLPLVGLWVRLLLIPRPYLYAGILVVFAWSAYGGSRHRGWTCC